MKSKVFLLLFLSLLSSQVYSQKYGNALGIRVDRNTVGVIFKQRLLKSATLDGLLAFNTLEAYAKGLFNIHKPILYKGLNYFYGVGGHVGYYREAGPYMGLDLSVGLELKVPALPLLVSADVTPSVHVNHPRRIQLQTGVSVLFVMRSERDIRKKKRKRNKKSNGRSLKERLNDALDR